MLTLPSDNKVAEQEDGQPPLKPAVRPQWCPRQVGPGEGLSFSDGAAGSGLDPGPPHAARHGSCPHHLYILPLHCLQLSSGIV